MVELMIEARGIEAAYGAAPVLDGVDLVVPTGAVVALLGPNGAGKTTMVRILATLRRPDGGSATVDGLDLRRDAARIRSLTSLTGQHVAVDDLLTGRENLELMARLRHLPRRRVPTRARELIEQLDLGEVADRRAATYSGGTRRRLDLAMSLLTTPRLLFLDEPTTGLDPRSREQMWVSVQELVRGGTTVLLTTQYLEEADRLADSVVVLAGGRVVAAGSAQELKDRVGGELVRLHFDGPLPDPSAVPRAEACHEQGWWQVPTDGSVEAVRDVLADVDRLGLAPTRLDLVRPTLDDVFLALTAAARS